MRIDRLTNRRPAVNAEQRKRLEAFTARFEEQDKKIQKVSAQLEMRQPPMSLARINPRTLTGFER